MTVPGKGGRPRKWCSDVDRVRAFRARERGEEEPATFDRALADGDELARALEQVRQLHADLRAAASAAERYEAVLASERRRTATNRRKLDRAQSGLTALRQAVELQERERRAMAGQIATLRSDNAALRQRVEELAVPGPNRAARRQASRRDRKNW